MEYRYKPPGVCSTEMIIDVEDNIIKDIKIINGCDGNLKGIAGSQLNSIALSASFENSDSVEGLNILTCHTPHVSSSCF